MPYWDCTLDAALSVPRDTSLFSEDFMGNGDGYVVTGAFKGASDIYIYRYICTWDKLGLRDVIYGAVWF
ncbi:hypothetical protein DPMN_169847 [Dreissena polymorpha]|uniref:Uncharacterized protein n=1 Tax=Dreissena polymorpha TaxID=45954 RepID=A0A9D4DV40_DREPO|nr:hypothetical protein DPMN_169847 [Dreissena polymorpha]